MTEALKATWLLPRRFADFAQRLVALVPCDNAVFRKCRMAESGEKDAVVDDNPYRSPDTSPLPTRRPYHNHKRSNLGCLVLFLLALPVLDTFGFVASMAGPYGPVVHVLGLAGFACGAALVAYVSVAVMHRRWWSSCLWAICGLIGMFLATAAMFAFLSA